MLVIHIKKSVFRGSRPSVCMYVAKEVSLRVMEVCVYYDVLITFSKGTEKNMQICELVYVYGVNIFCHDAPQIFICHSINRHYAGHIDFLEVELGG